MTVPYVAIKNFNSTMVQLIDRILKRRTVA